MPASARENDAADENSRLIRCATVSENNIIVEINGRHEGEDISVRFEKEELDVKAKPYCEEHSTFACILVDDSAFKDEKFFGLIKKNIIYYIQRMGPEDKMCLFSGGKEVLNGKEKRFAAEEKVKELNFNTNGENNLFSALEQAHKRLESESYDRKYVIVFSGADTGADISDKSPASVQAPAGQTPETTLSQDGNTKKEEKQAPTLETVSDLYSSRSIPVYAVHYSSAEPSYNKIVRSSGGSRMKNIDEKTFKIDNNEPSPYEAYFKCFLSEINDVTVLKLSKPESDFSIDKLFVSVSEGAKEESVAPDSTAAPSEDSSPGNVPTPPKPTENPVGKEKDKNSSSLVVIIAVAAVLLIAAVIAVVLAVARKNKSENDENSGRAEARPTGAASHIRSGRYAANHGGKAVNARQIALQIKTGGSSEQNIKTRIANSFVFGRSENCDICIDDPRMSGEHFVIENDDGELYVTDLQSRNGTVLNGVRVSGRRRLKNGDKIVAGLTSVVLAISDR